VPQPFGIQTASLVAVLGATSPATGLALQGRFQARRWHHAAAILSVQDRRRWRGRGRVKSLSLFMTELVAPKQHENPSAKRLRMGSRDHQPEPRSSTRAPILGEPVPAGKTGQTAGDCILNHLQQDPRIDA
jgi:small conductance mechanosensitive channel